MPGTLDGGAQQPLMLGANSGLAGRFYLGPVRNEPTNPVHILVVNAFDVLNAEGADPTTRPISPARPGTTRAGTLPARRTGASWASRSIPSSATRPESTGPRRTAGSRRDTSLGSANGWRLWRGGCRVLCCCHIRDAPPNGFTGLERQVINVIHGRAFIARP